VVLAIGNPLGLRQTVTSGIISAKGRQTGLSDGSFEDFLQTDAPINQGNSGGALVNLNGELVGINSQILSPSGGSIGIGFAIPSNMAKSVMQQLVRDGQVHRGMLGVGIQDVTSALAENFGLKEVRGALVNSVMPGSPAEKAGLKQGDVILSLNGKAISDGNELRNKIAQTAPGGEVVIGFARGGSEQTAKATLGEFRPKPEAGGDRKDEAEPTAGKLGVTLEPVTPQIAGELGLKNAAGSLAVDEVEPGSPADEAGIQQGDVILEIDRQPVKTLEEIKIALGKAKNRPVLLLINRKNQTFYVTAVLENQ
jgi:S1-C subfamily serine protease